MVNRLRISGSSVVSVDDTFKLIIEPWAEEFVVGPKEEYILHATEYSAPGEFCITHIEDAVVVWLEFPQPVNCEVWRNGQLIFESCSPM